MIEGFNQKFNLHDPPQGMYFAHRVTGRRAGLKHIKLDFGKPVLGFTQPRVDSDDWFIVTIRTSVEKDELGFYYTDEDEVMLELIPIVTKGDEFDANSTGATDTLFFNGQLGFVQTLETFYKQGLTDIQGVNREEVDYEDVYYFLNQYKAYIEDTIPHILI